MPIRRLLFWGFRPPRDVVAAGLGALEQQVMDRIWSAGEVSVRDVYESFDGSLAYTTLMTTLDRLFKKGLLERRKEGRAYLYTAVATREELTREAAADVVRSILGDDPSAAQPVLSTLVEAVGQRDVELLDELGRLIEKKRRELDRQEQG
jgi:BlaI family penicillinase repressor